MSETERLLTDNPYSKEKYPKLGNHSEGVRIWQEKAFNEGFAAGEKQGFNDAISWAGQLCFNHEGGYKRHIDCVQCIQEKRKELSG